MSDARSMPGADTDADVAVVGFGPVGATLAGLLAGRGVRTVVIDREVDIYPLPRAAHVDHEIMRIMQELGCADEMLTEMRPNSGMDFLTATHEVLLSMRSPGETALGWPASLFINQPRFEAQLRAAVRRLGADVRLGSGVTEIDASESIVRLTLDNGTQLTTRFVVGCDGARSFTRRVVGAPMHDLQFEEPWLVVDLVLHHPVPSLPTTALQVCDPARPHTLVPMPEPRFRFEFMLLPGESPARMQTPEMVSELTAGWLPAGAAELERCAVYTFHGLVAQQWRSGRVLLAGDAAHQMPPFLGQGMCSGMRDAANLAWKLRAVLDGAPEELLDTYQAEREPHVRAIVDAAVGFGRIICTLDAEQAADRDAAMLADRAAAAEAPAPAPSGIPLPSLTGSLVAAGGGRPALQPVVAGKRLDDLVGPRWLVVVADVAMLASESARWWSRTGATVLSADEHPTLLPVLDHGAGATVVRPDRYVFGVGDLDELTAVAQQSGAVPRD